MYPRACIVTTLRDADKVLHTFINYHLNIGFQHLFLFLDDPQENSTGYNYPDDKVTFVKHDQILINLWKHTKGYQQYGHFIQSEVMARQILNAEVAVKMALEAGYNWILHIDIDELFLLDGYDTVYEHFNELENQKLSVIRYLNHEGVPEKYETDDYFLEVTLFKKNFELLNDLQKEVLQQVIGAPKSYFRFYKNGKSAAKLHKNLIPLGVHSFSGQAITYTDTRTSILHYPCCGFNYFWNKYKTLGNFSDKWFDKDEISKKLPAHAFSRDIVQTDDIELGRRFYKAVFMQQGNGKIQHLIENNIYFRAFPLMYAYSDLKN